MVSESYVETHQHQHQSSISLYTLRYANSNDNWTIQAIFRDHAKYDFSERLIFTGVQKEPCAILYELKLNDYGMYRIRISQKRTKVSYHYDENKVRQLIDNQSHQFLFDVHFEPNTFVFSPPVRNE